MDSRREQAIVRALVPPLGAICSFDVVAEKVGGGKGVRHVCDTVVLYINTMRLIMK